jgi:integrase
MRRNKLGAQLHRHLAAAGLPRVRFHDLRHTAGSLMLRQGIDIATIAKTLGHKDPSMTLRRYSHVLDDMREDAARKMDEGLGFESRVGTFSVRSLRLEAKRALE